MMLLARIISNIANPLIIFAPVPYLLVLKTTDDLPTAVTWEVISLVFLFGVAIFVIFEVGSGRFSDLDVSHREQRPKLFIFSSIVALCYLFCLFISHGPAVLYSLVIGVLTGIVVLSFINRTVKASVHVAMITALLCGIAIVYKGNSWLLLLLIPVIAWARLKTKRHTMLEVVIGGMIGLLLTVFLYGIIELVS